MGGRPILSGFRERAAEPVGLPDWMILGAGTTAVVVVVCAFVRDGGSLPLAAQLLCGAVALVPWIPWGLRATSWSYAVCTLGALGALALTGADPIVFGLVALAAARLAAYARIAHAAAFGVAGIGLIIVRTNLEPIDWFLWKSYIELALAVGWALRSQRLLVVRTEQASNEHARLAALEERRRIARDIHDTLAHSLTVMMVHLNSARLQLAHDPEGVAESLDELALLGRASLDEARRSVGLLSDVNCATEPVDPTSAAAAVEHLVASFRRAGVVVDLSTDVAMEHVGLLADAPTNVWGTAYRVIQESLANAVKHAPGAAVDIGIDIDDAGIRIEVVNSLRGDTIALEVPSGGHGIRGMRERVALLHGSVTAGGAEGRWVVRAHLPLTPNAAEAHRPVSLGRVS